MYRFILILMSCLLSLPAAARTLSIDWAGGNYLPSVTDPNTNGYYVGSYQQGGFSTAIYSSESDVWGTGPVLGTLSSDNTGFGQFPQKLVVARQDGGVFNLKSLNIPMAYTGLLYTVDVYDKVADTSTLGYIAGFFANVQLTGLRADGTTVTSVFSPWHVAQNAGAAVSAFWTNTKPLFGIPDFGNGLRDLTSLAIEFTFPDPFKDFCRLNARRADPAFGLKKVCMNGGPVVDPLYSLGASYDSERYSYSFGLDVAAGPRNDSFFMSLNRITLDADIARTPAPVPLTPPGFLLAAAFGLLPGMVTLSRRRRRKFDRAAETSC